MMRNSSTSLFILGLVFSPFLWPETSRFPLSHNPLLSGSAASPSLIVNSGLNGKAATTQSKSFLEYSSRAKRLNALLDSEPSLRSLANKLVILVLSDPEGSRIDLIRSTWAVGVPNVHFVGSCSACTLRISGIAEDRLNLFPKVLATFSSALEQFPEAELFMKVDLDTYVFLH